MPNKLVLHCIRIDSLHTKPPEGVHIITGAPKLINSDLFLEKRARPTVPIKTRVFIGTVARFSRNKSLLISFGAPVI